MNFSIVHHVCLVLSVSASVNTRRRDETRSFRTQHCLTHVGCGRAGDFSCILSRIGRHDPHCRLSCDVADIISRLIMRLNFITSARRSPPAYYEMLHRASFSPVESSFEHGNELLCLIKVGLNDQLNEINI